MGLIRNRWHRLTTVLTASATASVTGTGLGLAGIPLALDYVVRPGDTLSHIALSHDTTVEKLVERNDLSASGDHVMAGQRLRIPAAHTRPTRGSRAGGPDRPGGRTDDAADEDARRIVRYTVRPGDTPSALAVRFHAWTDEVVERNGEVLHVGETVEIPVVLAAAARERRASARSGADAAERSGPSRATVRRVITRTARRHGVDPQLALAVSWQEAGWRMHHVSSAGAVGAMQIMPATGEWMSGVVGRDLDLEDLHDNVTAGVVLLDLLRERARPRVAVAGYYQGLAGVRRHGMHKDTKRYVANVMALKDRFERGFYPA